MEEVAPVTASGGTTLLAPQEVQVCVWFNIISEQLAMKIFWMLIGLVWNSDGKHVDRKMSLNLYTVFLVVHKHVWLVHPCLMIASLQLQEPEKAELKGDGEKSKTDRNRERRKKKKNQKLREKQRLKKLEMKEKLNPDLANKRSKAEALRDLEKKSKSNKSLTVVKVLVCCVTWGGYTFFSMLIL